MDAEGNSESSPQRRPARILVVDDSAIERTGLAQILRQQGYDVDEAESGNAALRLLADHAVDLLLLDLQMPETDGFAVLAHLQQRQPGAPVILLSGLRPDQIQHQMRRLPTPELPPLLLKPVDVEQLLRVVELKLAGELPG